MLEPPKNQRFLVGEPAGVSTVPHMSKQEAMGKALALASCKQQRLQSRCVPSVVQLAQHGLVDQEQETHSTKKCSEAVLYT